MFLDVGQFAAAVGEFYSSYIQLPALRDVGIISAFFDVTLGSGDEVSLPNSVDASVTVNPVVFSLARWSAALLVALLALAPFAIWRRHR